MGRAPQISRESVLAAALRLADEQGLNAVTMHAVAKCLRVTPMALYRHVDDKNALLDGLVEVLLGECPLPPPDVPWDERLTALAAGIRDTARRHPTAFPLLLTRPAVTPAARLARPERGPRRAAGQAGVRVTAGRVSSSGKAVGWRRAVSLIPAASAVRRSSQGTSKGGGSRTLPEQDLHQPVEQGVLVVHVPVQRHRRYPQALGHGVHGDRVEALFVGQPERCGQHRFPADLRCASHDGQSSRSPLVIQSVLTYAYIIYK